MKIIKFIIIWFYIIFVIPIMLIFMGSLIYGGVVETIKIIKKSNA